MSMPLAFLTGPYRLSMGLRRAPLADWIRLGDDARAQLRERRRLLTERRSDVLAALPGSRAGQREILTLLVEHLPRALPEYYARDNDSLHCRPSGERVHLSADDALIALAGRLVPEDLCLLERGPDGYRLTAAFLCFPAHWRLHEKLGRGLAAIHGPVPGYDERLAGPVERFLERLPEGELYERANWTVVEDPALFHPHARAPVAGLTADNAGLRLWLRAERQTFRRLPETGGVLFTIRTYVQRLSEIAADAGIARSLAERLRELPPAMAAYKGVSALEGPLLAWLDDRS